MFAKMNVSDSVIMTRHFEFIFVIFIIISFNKDPTKLFDFNFFSYIGKLNYIYLMF